MLDLAKHGSDYILVVLPPVVVLEKNCHSVAEVCGL